MSLAGVRGVGVNCKREEELTTGIGNGIRARRPKGIWRARERVL